MEYREAPSSPGASSVHSLNMEHLGSPTPSPPPTHPVDMDDDRLPNELLDEICEDIGMKEGTDLDFVEFLMEQDMVDPQVYMTPEAIRNTLASVSSTTVPQTSGKMSSMTRSSDSNGRSCSSPSTTYSLASSTGCTVAPSSGSTSPAAKRFHKSTSGPTSPVRTDPPKLFKAPQTPPTQRRPSSQSIASPSISSTQGPQMSPLPARSQSPAGSGGSVPQSPVQKHPPPYSQSNNVFTYNPQMMGQKGGVPPAGLPNQYQRQNSAPQGQGVYQRRPAPPNVNVQNMQPSPHMQQQQQKWGMCQSPQVNPQTGNMPMNNMPQRPGMFNPNNTHSQHYNNRPLESPNDMGYYSGDTGSVRSMGSASTVPSSLSSMPSGINAGPNHNINNAMHMRHCPPGSNGQKSVHFADMPPNGDPSVPLQRQQSNDSMAGYGTNYDPNSINTDCDLDGEFRDPNHRGVPTTKILPRLSHSVKSEIAPYTVPNGQAMSPYNDYGRTSRPGSGDNVMVQHQQQQQQQQQFDYNKPPGSEMYNVDNNQNSLQHMNNCNNAMQPQNGDPNFRPPCPGGVPVGMQSHPGHFEGQNNMQQQQQPGQMYPGQSMQDGNQYKQQYNMSTNCDNNNMCRTMPDQKMNAGMNMMNRDMPGSYPQVGGPQNMGPSQHGQMVDCAQGSYPAMQNFIVNGGCGDASQMQQMQNSVNNEYDQNNGMYPGTPGGPNMGPQGANSWNSANPGHQQPQMGMTPKMQQHPGMSMGANSAQNPLQPGTPQNLPCTIPNCQSCKTGSPHRPKMMQSQQIFIQHLITDNSNAFRSHPLFPLLRDLCIADMNFASPSFPYQLISNLPTDFDKLLQNFLHRNPPSGNYQTNFSVESVVMEALHFAHGSLIGKQYF